MDLQIIPRSKIMGNESTEPKMLMVTVVNVHNFLCMRHWKAKIAQLYQGRLKGAARL